MATPAAKVWTYAEITAAAAELIGELMEQYRLDRDDSTRQRKRDWAIGIYIYWSTLTKGVRTTEEDDRMEALTRTGE